MTGTAFGIGSGQMGQLNPWVGFPYSQGIGASPFTQQGQQGFGGYASAMNPFGLQTGAYAQPLQQVQHLLQILPQQLQQLHYLQQHQHSLQQQQLHQLQQLLQLVPQQLQQLQQLIQLLPQQLHQIQQLVQFVPQQINQLQQQLLGHQTPGGVGLGVAQPFGTPFGWSAQGAQPGMAGHGFGVPSGQIM
jgi:hypothetical protein